MNRRGAGGVVRSLFVVAIASSFGGGCLTRPVSSNLPTVKDSVKVDLRATSIDKIDLLFDIDNSASMGDKQAYLAVAVPDLLARLITPNCVDASGNAVKIGGAVETSDANGSCPDGTSKPEFKPVVDMHIAIVTSSLGARGVPNDKDHVAECADAAHPNADNHGELYDVGGAAAGPVADAAGGFLSWFPVNAQANAKKTPPAKPIQDAGALAREFADVVSGVGQDGCGIESQLESWYRFLIQPDPYASIVVTNDHAAWQDVDTTILKQRHDFLRPDSLVAVIDLTDENDSEIDVRSLQQTGWKFLDGAWQPPKATAACATNPNDPSCTSCAFVSNGAGCDGSTYKDASDWAFDVNLRHVHTKQKYGVDPQFPIDRYFRGLTQTLVPDRNGEYPPNAGAYVGDAKCTNPLYAAALPDGSDTSPAALCSLPVGTRTPDLVFYGIIGGVPSQLLHFDPNDPNSLNLSADDWTKILGKDPEHYDYSGIDPHMIESFQPRPGIAAGDTVSGPDWVTNAPNVVQPGGAMPFAVDREYACIFRIVDPKTGNPAPRDCTNEASADACDCPNDAAKLPAASSIPPVCNATTPTQQDFAKVYPTPRELLLAKKMSNEVGGGKLNQGIVASLCPIDVTEQGAGDPLYGYRPAVTAIVERLKNALVGQCLPEALAVNADDGTVPCLVLEALPAGSTCDPALGLAPADPKAAESALREIASESGITDGGGADYVICTMQELTPQKNAADFDASGTCTSANDPGWCYVSGKAAGGSCPQAVKFSPKNASGGRIVLQCINETDEAADGG